MEPFWRAGGTQAEKSAKYGLNGLYVLAAIIYFFNFESHKHLHNKF